MSKKSFVKFLARLFGDGPNRKVFRRSSYVAPAGKVDQNVKPKNRQISRKTRNKQNVRHH